MRVVSTSIALEIILRYISAAGGFGALPSLDSAAFSVLVIFSSIHIISTVAVDGGQIAHGPGVRDARVDHAQHDINVREAFGAQLAGAVVALVAVGLPIVLAVVSIGAALVDTHSGSAVVHTALAAAVALVELALFVVVQGVALAVAHELGEAERLLQSRIDLRDFRKDDEAVVVPVVDDGLGRVLIVGKLGGLAEGEAVGAPDRPK